MSLCKFLGFTNKSSHRALGDAEATHKVFNAICENIKVQSGRKKVEYNFLKKLSQIPKKNVSSLLQI